MGPRGEVLQRSDKKRVYIFALHNQDRDRGARFCGSRIIDLLVESTTETKNDESLADWVPKRYTYGDGKRSTRHLTLSDHGLSLTPSCSSQICTFRYLWRSHNPPLNIGNIQFGLSTTINPDPAQL